MRGNLPMKMNPIEGVKLMQINLAALICGMIAILCSGFSLGMAVSNLLNRNDSKKKSDRETRK